MAETFGKLKKDLLFHEKRMQLLLHSHVAEDFGYNLHEKSQARNECASDCSTALQKFERGASDARLSGRWDELKLANLFQLEVPLRDVVGSSKFEPPAATDRTSLRAMIQRLQAVAEKHEEFANSDSAATAEALEALIDKVDFPNRDVTRMKEALASKIQVIAELDDLASVLQSSGFTVAQKRADLEALRKATEAAADDGEMATFEASLKERLTTLEQIIDVMFYQAHTIDQTVEANVSKRSSNIAAFQSASAMLECIRGEKEELIRGCQRDMGKIARGMAYEDKAKDQGRGKVLAQMRESTGRLQELDSRQTRLAQRLQDLYKEFAETEAALAQVGVERAEAVAAHVDLVEAGRHATADYTELIRFAEVYTSNLDNTRAQYNASVEVLDNLSKLLLQNQSFDGYDFNASGKRLHAMRRKACVDLNVALNDYERSAQRLVSRKEEAILQLREVIDKTECELELRKEVLDPQAKRYVLQLRELEGKLEAAMAERDQWIEKVNAQKQLCLDKITRHLADDEVLRIDDEIDFLALQGHEKIVDQREALAEAKDAAGSTATTVVEEKLRLVNERQTTDRAKLSTISSARAKNSRVTSVRDEIRRTKVVATPASSVGVLTSSSSSVNNNDNTNNSRVASSTSTSRQLAEQARRELERLQAEEERLQQQRSTLAASSSSAAAAHRSQLSAVGGGGGGGTPDVSVIGNGDDQPSMLMSGGGDGSTQQRRKPRVIGSTTGVSLD